MAKKWIVIFGGLLHPSPGSLCAFMPSDVELARFRASGMFEVYEGSRKSLAEMGRIMLNDEFGLSIGDMRVATALSTLKANAFDEYERTHTEEFGEVVRVSGVGI